MFFKHTFAAFINLFQIFVSLVKACKIDMHFDDNRLGLFLLRTFRGVFPLYSLNSHPGNTELSENLGLFFS